MVLVTGGCDEGHARASHRSAREEPAADCHARGCGSATASCVPDGREPTTLRRSNGRKRLSSP